MEPLSLGRGDFCHTFRREAQRIAGTNAHLAALGMARQRLCLLGALVPFASAFANSASLSCRAAPLARASVALMDAASAGEQFEALIPKRWKNVHDCERPSRWRETMDEEDCEVWRAFGDDADKLESKISIPDVTLGSGAHIAGAESSEMASAMRPTTYRDLIPRIETADDLLTACARSAGSGRLVIVKFYSKKCRACLRIAAKYRRLALDYASDIDCFESCDADSKRLYQMLNVTQVPSVMIFDGRRVTRLAHYACKPAEWSKVDSKIRVAMKSIKKRRDLHKIFGAEMVDDLQDAYSYFT